MLPTADPIDILHTHDRWATHQLLDAMDKLPVDALHRSFPIGLSTLHDTIVHNVGAIQVWTDTLARRTARPWISDEKRTVAELRRIFDVAIADLAAVARQGPMDEAFTRTNKAGMTFNLSRGEILMHLATHGVHHRAQALNMLRQLGVSPLPQSSVTQCSIAHV
jgi:uncharacterized damage-inducible protein DinB